MVSALDTIVKSGRARYIGVSNFLAWRLAKALGVADARRATRFVSVQPRYSLLFREIERELLPMAAEEGLGVLPYNPLAGGLLTAKHRFDEGPRQGTRFTLGTAKERYQNRYWQQRMFDTVDSLRQAAADYGISLTTAAVAWVLSNPVVTAPIIGASRADQLDATLAAASVALDPTLKARFDELTVEYRHGDALR